MPFDDGSIKQTWGEKFSPGKGVVDGLVIALLATNYFSDHAAVYGQYRSYLMKIGDDHDLSGITAGLIFKY